MVVVSYSGKEINAKLVYYGAGLSGKTTNLESIYEAVPESSRGKMVSMKTQSDRTLFFDLLPLDLGEIMGFKTRFLLYTVPGQVFYNATRKLVLKGADAIVFVADSEVGKMDENKESLSNLRANLIEYDLKLDEIPWVIQYNKRDIANVYTVDELNAELNPGGVVPVFEAVATQGRGVFETFRGISHLLMEKVTRELRRTPMSGGRTGRTEDAASRSATHPDPSIASAIPFGPASPATPATPKIPAAAPVASAPAPSASVPTPSTPPPAPAAPTPASQVPPPVFASPAPPPPPPARPAPMPVAANGSETGASAPSAPVTAESGRGIGSASMRTETSAPFHYGRELSLPSTSGASATSPAMPGATSDPHQREIEASRPIDPPSETPLTFDSRTASRQAPPVASDPPAHAESRASLGVLNESSLGLDERSHSTPSRPSVAVAAAPERDTLAADASSGATELVVPVSIPRGASREIVLRIVITNDPD